MEYRQSTLKIMALKFKSNIQNRNSNEKFRLQNEIENKNTKSNEKSKKKKILGFVGDG